MILIGALPSLEHVDACPYRPQHVVPPESYPSPQTFPRSRESKWKGLDKHVISHDRFKDCLLHALPEQNTGVFLWSKSLVKRQFFTTLESNKIGSFGFRAIWVNCSDPVDAMCNFSSSRQAFLEQLQ